VAALVGNVMCVCVALGGMGRRSSFLQTGVCDEWLHWGVFAACHIIPTAPLVCKGG